MHPFKVLKVQILVSFITCDSLIPKDFSKKPQQNVGSPCHGSCQGMVSMHLPWWIFWSHWSGLKVAAVSSEGISTHTRGSAGWFWWFSPLACRPFGPLPSAASEGPVDGGDRTVPQCRMNPTHYYYWFPSNNIECQEQQVLSPPPPTVSSQPPLV